MQTGLIRQNKESITLKFEEGMASRYFHKPWKIQTATKTQKNDFTKAETVSEPGIVWQKNTNPKKVIFSSMHDQEKSNYQYWLSLTPEQRIASDTRLIREIFAEELKKPRKNNRIMFDEL